MAGQNGTASPTLPVHVDADEAPLEDVGYSDRYQARAVLGVGGMGEVALCKDRRIGREVAVKVARAGTGTSGDAVARFAREARVQGQLEHPAIVPVYDLGKRPDGAVFFTMKRVRGLTLERVVEGLRQGDAEIERGHSRRRLLSAFAQVCQAIHFAHTRGVLHRDLKPGNVMLGDFGEVYVLDWGLAKLVGDTTPEGVVERTGPTSISTSGPQTTSGSVMGTPGYMAPEQIRGEIERLDARADVYALGALLYELLTWQPLHPRTSAGAAMQSTLAGADARASVRAPEREVPPELEAICVRATALALEDRFAGVRELVDAIERFLDGDRDLERRRELARAAAEAALAATEHALAHGGEPERQQALAHAGRALALDPGNAIAMRAMIQLLVAPPARVPEEVQRELARGELEMVRVAAGKGGYAYLSWFMFVPFLFWLGLQDARPLVAWLGLVGAATFVGFFGGRMRFTDARMHFVGLVLSSAAIVLMAPIFGPYVLAPGLACANTIAYLLHARRRWRPLTFVLGVLTIVVPILLEVLGLWPRTVSFVGDAMVIHSWTVHLPEWPTTIVLTVSLVSALIVPGIYVLRVREALSVAERDLHVQSWHLRQLIPPEARDALAPRANDPAPLLGCDAPRRR